MFNDGHDSVGGYKIANSLRFRSSASTYLSRTFSTNTGNPFTVSCWLKRGTLGTRQFFYAATDSVNNSGIGFDASDRLIVVNNSGADNATMAVFRDPSAWYHIVMQSTGSAVTVWVNNVQVASIAIALTLFNQNAQHTIGRLGVSALYFDGFIADFVHASNATLTPSDFAIVNTDGVWTPKAYTGTYGTNGFYLKFNDGSNLTNLCLDRSGNGNNWTATNVSLTAGATYDWMVDTPTNNYAVLNLLDKNANITISDGNLSFATSAVNYGARATVGIKSNKWYWEATVIAIGSTNVVIGVAQTGASWDLTYVGSGSSSWGYISTGQKYNAGSGAAYGAAFTTGDVIGVAFDADAGTLTFYKNDVSQGQAFSGVSGSTTIHPALSGQTSSSIAINFGQRPFTYTPPTGFKALCTANLPAVTVTNGRKHFDVLTHAGNNTAGRSITGAQFQPDFAWVKNRSAANDHILVDSVRGVTKALYSDATNAEATVAGSVTAFNADGISLGYDGSAIVNQTGNNYVDWLWKAGGAAVTNTAGSITSQVSANTAAGFSIVTYTGTGANATVGHGLGVAPKMVIVKQRSAAGNNWVVYHANLTSNAYYLTLNTTNAQSNAVNFWNNTSPTSSAFSIGSVVDNNGAASTYVAYCFVEVAGFSKFGSYTGNGSSDGPFVFCGFRPRWVLCKSSSAAATNWFVVDTARSPENVIDEWLLPNGSNAEQAQVVADVTANGFKIRNSLAEFNGSGSTYIYVAFAENPFGGSNVAPATAR